jgi:hypothetical protein
VAAPGEPRERHLTSFHLEGLRLEALSADERAWAEKHQADCARCRELAESLRQSRHEFADQALPRTRPAIRARVARRRSSLWLWITGAALVPAAAALLLFARARPQPAPAEDADVQEKGGPTLFVVARRGDRVFAARPGEQLHPGDQIRFVLTHVRHPYAIIASVDGGGRANIYVPYEGAASVPVTMGDRTELEGSIILDARLGPERLFALFSREPLATDQVRSALSAIGARGAEAIRRTLLLPVGAGAQSSFLLEKVSP